MKNIAFALAAAFRSLPTPKMLALVLWPMLASTAFWVGAALMFWGHWTNRLNGLLHSQLLEKWVGHAFSATASNFLVTVLLGALLILAIYLSTLAITAIFSMPAIVGHISHKFFPDLEREKGGHAAGSMLNTAAALGLYCAGMALSLPVWLVFSPLAAVLSMLLMAYLNQRLFRYDALAEHASKAEYELVVQRSRHKLFLLGLIAGFLQFMPLLNAFLPVYMGLAFTHLCLAELKQARAASAA